jgi:hypothetical protein
MTKREHAALWRGALEQFDRAEQLLLELLARSDHYGDSPWQVVEWEELLDHIASLHSRARFIRTRMARLPLEMAGAGMGQVPIWAIFEELAGIRREVDELRELPDEAIQPERVLCLALRMEGLCRLWLRRAEEL